MDCWDNDFSLRFLEEYRKEPILWNSAHARHRDRKKAKQIWRRISGKLGRPVQELKRKKESLLATFRCHLRRKRASSDYQPAWFAYDFMESFLASVVGLGSSNTINTITRDAEVSSKSQNSTSKPILTDVSTKVKIEPVDEEDSLSVNVTTNSHSTALTPAISQVVRRSYRNSFEPQDTGNINNSHREELVDASVNNAASKRSCLVSEEDDCDLYAKMLAKRLRKVPEEERDLLMYEIDGLVLNRIHRNQPSLEILPTSS